MERSLADHGVTELTRLSNLDDDCLDEAFPRELNRALCQEFMSLGQAPGLPFTGLKDQNKLSPSWTMTLDPTDICQRHFHGN